ncbi:MAG: 16S rRNA (adenine(1518)-N(6)/adenine(1519)-N(6))-dimethyltransferase RsmA [Balneolales bacterium]|nr:16S rRNA (adenine(1518)-N(6)/adenine(1519)-N(6))-dimethyltransferase RsmA [Balneolales bacterium]
MSLKPKKSLGQHFLRDENILRNIVREVDARPGDRVVEIGPGEGALTSWLVKSCEDVVAVEVDQRAVAILGEQFPDLDVRHADILKTPWSDVLKADGANVIAGNIPYYITSPILFKAMDAGPLFRKAVFLMQKEVAERLVAQPGTKAYGILSVQAQLLGRVEYCFTVSRHVFFPKPKVESAVISFYPRNEPLAVSLEDLKLVVRTAFNQRRKMLSNSLKTLIQERDADTMVGAFDWSLRPEQLKPEEFVKLTQILRP